MFPVALLFRYAECHNIQPCEKTSMSLTEPDLRISHIRLFSRTHRRSGSSVCCKGDCWRRAILGSVSVTRPLIPLRSTANPFEWATARTGHYPDYTSNMSWSDCHTAIPPPCLLSACWRLPEGTARLSQVPMQTVGLPATDSDPGPARHAHQIACHAAGFQDMKPLALRRR